MKTLYQSDDGKIFESASACEDYERSRQKSDTFIADSYIYNAGGFLLLKLISILILIVFVIWIFAHGMIMIGYII